MNCPNCGTFNNDGFKFCIKCGNSLETTTTNSTDPVATEEVLTEQPVEVASSIPVEAAPAQPVFEQSQQQPVQPQQPKKKINPKLLIIIAAAIIVIVAGIVFVPKLFGNKEKTNMSDSLTDSSSFWLTNDEDLYALFDVNGKQVTKFNYKYVGDFVNGTAYVKNVDDQYGIISEKGKMIADFGKYSYISQITGLYEVRDESYNKYLIDGTGKVLYELENYEVKSYDSDSFFILENEDTDTYHVLNYEGKELTSFPIDSDADSPITSERDDYVSIFYNNKEYIINPFSKKVINTFDSDKAFTIKGISENGTILLNSYSDWSTRDEPTTYKVVKDNKVNNLPEECTSISFDENDDNNIVCQNDDGRFLLNDNYQKGIKISTNLYVNKVYSDNKGYAYERINSNNLVLRVDFVQNENTVKEVSCRELADSGYMANGLYVLETKNYLDNCKGESGGAYEYYNTSGEKMFGRAFDSASAFDENNLAIVNEENTREYSLIDTQGKQVGNSYESIKLHDYFNYYIVMKDKMYGVLDDKGKEIVPCKYSRIDITNNNYAKLKTSDSKNIIFDLSKGKEILSLNDTESNVNISKNYITTSFGGKTRYYSYTTGKLFYEK